MNNGGRGRQPIWTKLTSLEPCGAPGAAKPSPIDLVCGTLLPIRWSKYCVVYDYQHAIQCARDAAEDKIFEIDVIVQTTRGSWDFQGRRGHDRIDSSKLVCGMRGRGYGCRHDPRFPDSNLIASLRPGSVDDEEPLFVDETVRAQSVPSLEWAVAADDTETFDSRVFETFDVASARSWRGGAIRRPSRLRMERAKRFIEDHANEPIALADIAASVGLSPFVCLRQFKTHAGATPHAFLAAVRLRRAKRLLRATKRPVADVATAVGIADQCYFARWFGRATGTSPSAYRLQFSPGCEISDRTTVSTSCRHRAT